MLLEKNIVISNDGEWYFISQKVQWYNSLSEKLAKKNQSRISKL
jgi:competence protein CoiA